MLTLISWGFCMVYTDLTRTRQKQRSTGLSIPVAFLCRHCQRRRINEAEVRCESTLDDIETLSATCQRCQSFNLRIGLTTSATFNSETNARNVLFLFFPPWIYVRNSWKMPRSFHFWLTVWWISCAFVAFLRIRMLLRLQNTITRLRLAWM